MRSPAAAQPVLTADAGTGWSETTTAVLLPPPPLPPLPRNQRKTGSNRSAPTRPSSRTRPTPQSATPRYPTRTDFCWLLIFPRRCSGLPCTPCRRRLLRSPCTARARDSCGRYAFVSAKWSAGKVTSLFLDYIPKQYSLVARRDPRLYIMKILSRPLLFCFATDILPKRQHVCPGA
jgi:hypothetical protein